MLAEESSTHRVYVDTTRGPSRARVSACRRSALCGVDRLCGLRQDGEQVTDDTEVDHVEDGSLFVLVDRDDRLGRLHAGAVLDGPGDAGRDVQLRGDLFAGLADLVAVRVPPRVDGCARGPDSGAQGVGELLDLGEVTAGSASTGDHDRGLGQLG